MARNCTSAPAAPPSGAPAGGVLFRRKSPHVGSEGTNSHAVVKNLKNEARTEFKEYYKLSVWETKARTTFGKNF